MLQLLEFIKKIKDSRDCRFSSSNYSKAHPLTGGKQIISENWRNLISVGASPIAITNCLNFGNPENPKVMGVC